MRLTTYAAGRNLPQRAMLWFSRRVDAELDDVAKVSMRRPVFFGRPFLGLVQTGLRGRSVWSVGEREFFAAVVSRTNACSFCVGAHGQIASKIFGTQLDDDWRDGRFGPRATAVAQFLEALTRDPEVVGARDLAAARAAGVEDAALAEAIYIAFTFNLINRIADALEFSYRSERDRLRGTWILRRNGYRLPRMLLRDSAPEAFDPR